MTIRLPTARTLSLNAIALAGISALIAEEALRQGIGPEVFGGLNVACALDRKPLETAIVAQSSLAGADAEWTEGGWIAVDDNTGDILWLDEAIALTSRRANVRSGFGTSPLIVGGRTTGFVDQEGLKLINGHGPHPIGEPDHAVADEQAHVFYTSGGSVFALDLSSRQTRRILTPEDFGMSIDEVRGLPPEGLLRLGDDGALYIAWRAQSSIWKVVDGAQPRLLVQRCVPEQLRRTHIEAPRIDLMDLGYSNEVKISISSVSDFVVLNSGELLVLGELRVGPEAHRSIELYGADGALQQAWKLAVPMAVGRFDRSSPRRILLWRRWTDGESDRRLVLMELEAEGYPR